MKKFALVLANDEMSIDESIESMKSSVSSVVVNKVIEFEYEYPEVRIEIADEFVNDLHVWYTAGNVESFPMEDFMEMEIE